MIITVLECTYDTNNSKSLEKLNEMLDECESINALHRAAKQLIDIIKKDK